jgi:hypothetical protein
LYHLPLVLLIGLSVAACGSTKPHDRDLAYLPAPALSPVTPKPPPLPAPPPPRARSAQQSVAYAGLPGLAARPRIVIPARPLQCVPFARKLSNVNLRGDAWTWWRSARGRYKRDRRPTVGSVLVLKRQGRSLGHLAVVTQILSDREIVVSHANWLNQGKIHLNTPVKDVSFWGNWSSVKVWYAPGNHYGGRSYRAHGFIHATDDHDGGALS